MTIDLGLLFEQALPYYEITFYSIMLSGEPHTPSCPLKNIVIFNKILHILLLGLSQKVQFGGTEEVSYQVKFLACKHRDLNLDSQYHIKLGMVAHTWSLGTGGCPKR